ncbi:MAG: putative Ig domain-containing protein [Ignavibacteriota bacterium]
MGRTLPAWLTITSAGVLSGTPPAAGTVSFTLRVTDTLSSSATKTFTLTINAVPAVTTTSLPAATSGGPYSQTLAQSGGTTPFTWQATDCRRG